MGRDTGFEPVIPIQLRGQKSGRLNGHNALSVDVGVLKLDLKRCIRSVFTNNRPQLHHACEFSSHTISTTGISHSATWYSSRRAWSESWVAVRQAMAKTRTSRMLATRWHHSASPLRERRAT